MGRTAQTQLFVEERGGDLHETLAVVQESAVLANLAADLVSVIQGLLKDGVLAVSDDQLVINANGKERDECRNIYRLHQA